MGEFRIPKVVPPTAEEMRQTSLAWLERIGPTLIDQWLKDVLALSMPTKFVLFPAESGMNIADLSRVIQGVATGIGFIGAGTILKRAEAEQVEGLTTAASIWLTGAIGMSVGAGQLWLSTLCAMSAWVILYGLARFETR